ncbi:MAG TPA: hypothetical protein VHQ00_08480, partial [Chloroflexota bacterium]|nr:hypothetical protein [Chloroflexota bacterium]
MNVGAGHLPGTAPLQEGGDFGARMVAGLSAFLDRQLAEVDAQAGAALATPRSPSEREAAAPAAREGLARRIGVVDARLPFHALELVGTTAEPALRVAMGEYEVYAVRWPVLRGVDGEGLLLRPREGPLARVVALPDADQTPECLAGLAPGLPPGAQLARRLAEAG